MTPSLRTEVHRRCKFAQTKADQYFDQLTHVRKQGNILTSKATHKFLQARRIYIHYCNEFQKHFNLPISV